MRDIVNTCVEKFKADHRETRRKACLLLVLALVVSAGVFWQLHSTGIAMANETYCGLEEHTHSEECYDDVLVCGMEDTEGVSETSEGHTHSGSCYEKQLVCGQEEHTHTVECMSDASADAESASDWEASLPVLSGVWADDVVAVAGSQVGYTESTKNFMLAEDGETRKGYTRYGEWAENPYGDWDAMFASFCLFYAGVSTDDFPEASGAYAWSEKLREEGFYEAAGDYTPVPGDLVFFDTDDDGKADSVGIVAKLEIGDEESGEESVSRLYVIRGDFPGTEDGTDAVCEAEYLPGDETLIGFGALPEQETAEEYGSDPDTVAQTDTTDASYSQCYDGEDYIVTVTYGDDAAIPEDAELTAGEYAKDSEEYLARYEEILELYGLDNTAAAEPDDAGGTEDIEDPEGAENLKKAEAPDGETGDYTAYVRLFDIGFYADGEEVEPSAEVNVTITYLDQESESDGYTVVHFSDDGVETIETDTVYEDGCQTVTFGMESFSSTATVDDGIMAAADSGMSVTVENNIMVDGTLTATLYDSEETVTDSTSYTFTWYRSKNAYLADSTGTVAAAPKQTTTYYSSLSTSTASGSSCTVGTYVFYYYYVAVSNENGTVVATSDAYYASITGAASYASIDYDGDKTLTATLYDGSGNKITTAVNGLSYTYYWYKSNNYYVSDSSTTYTNDDTPFASTQSQTENYKQVSGASGSALTLGESDSFHFYYLVVALKYTVGGTTYTATAACRYDGGFQYIPCLYTDITAMIIDDISADGVFTAALYDGNGNAVTGDLTYTWYRSESEYASDSNITYTDSNVPSDILYSVVTDEEVLDGNTLNVAENLGGLHYYYVIISYDGNNYISPAKYVRYSDQIENGGFEELGASIPTSSQIDQVKVPFWSTTNSGYTENGGQYRGAPLIEIGKYGESTATGTYGLAYSSAGSLTGDDTNNYFAELNSTEAATLYQSVLTAPGTTLYWSLYHQARSTSSDRYKEWSGETTATETSTDETTGVTTTTTYQAGTDSMYVIIMSDEDAEKLLADINESDSSYNTQQEVINQVAAAVLATSKANDGSTGCSNAVYGEIDGVYTGEYRLKNSDESVSATLWKLTTTKVRRTVTLTDSEDNPVDSESYTESDGWYHSGTGTGTYYTVSEWVNYSGSYTVPDGQYLTRFFFAAASAQGGVSNGNFIDSVSFTNSVNYTIEYWVWNGTSGKYELQSTDTETGSVTPYNRVSALNLSKYSTYAMVGSVTGTSSGGSEPATFDTSARTTMKVDAYTNYLSLYFKDAGVTVTKAIEGVNEKLLDNLSGSDAIESTFTITQSGGSSGDSQVVVPVFGASSGSEYREMDVGTYSISETSYENSILDGRYLWYKVEVSGEGITANNDGTYSFTLDDSNTVQNITFTNYYLPVVTLKKVDSTTSEALSGVTFVMYRKVTATDGSKNSVTTEIYYYDGCNPDSSGSYSAAWSTEQKTYTTDENGLITFSALEDGEYYLRELSTLDGYNNLGDEIRFVVTDGVVTGISLPDGTESSLLSIDNSDSLTIKIGNTPGYELPESGGAGTWGFRFAGLLLSGAAISLLTRRRRRA